MSLIKLQGNASGTGAFTIAAPNGNTDRTLTLPDATGTVLAAPAGSVTINSSAPSNSLTLDASGNLGIGATSPWSQISVLTANSSTTGYLGFKDAVLGGDIRFGKSSGASNNAIAGVWSNNDFQFFTNSTERARIDASGNLLVGTTNTASNAGAGVKIYPGTDGSVAVVGATSTTANASYSLYSTGAGAYRFYVTYAGGINATSTSITAISDQSLKENIRDLDTGLDAVMALRPRRFDWKEETQLEERNVAGFIAQEVEAVLPELVYDYKYNETETKKSLKMGDILPTLVKAIQEQQAIIADLTARLTALEAN